MKFLFALVLEKHSTRQKKIFCTPKTDQKIISEARDAGFK